jgi:hypothetical protein
VRRDRFDKVPDRELRVRGMAAFAAGLGHAHDHHPPGVV